ncbi:kinesin protein [Gigaspora rosea]|uniref:Kinesin protein n=1 Tax=Gigaspora rosea TaxID=44941 RepID=A0A397UHQ8_9GLOM|nr:kinesin protein [Gigaspora rosea]
MLIGKLYLFSALICAPREKRSEEELVAEEKYDVVAWVQVCELAPTGEYVPVQVLSQNSIDPGTFFLRQGLQQRIVLTLTHNSSRQFPWTPVTKIEIGRMNLLPTQNVQFKQDRTSVIVAQASWDSTLHDSIFLNRTTHSSSRVLLGLTWYVEAEKYVEPITFSMDVTVQVQGREARPPSKLIQLLNQSKVLWKSSRLFSITLKPRMTRKILELWRLNTASKYVRGEELLGDWKPREVSLVKNYKKIRESIRKKEAVDCIKQIIVLKGNKECEKHENPEELYKKILTLWRKKCDTITKKGYLFTPEDANDDHWVKKWYVLRRCVLSTHENILRCIYRPYLFIYESPKETEEQGAINLASVRVDYKRDLEDMLQRQHVFAIYTNNNAYILQASSKQDMVDWISKVSIHNSLQQLMSPFPRRYQEHSYYNYDYDNSKKKN